MAAHLGISQASISRIKDGKVLPSADIAERLAAYAGIPLDSFYRVQLLKRGVA
jgi:transcriptional regulator with XRE-family HTH domain